MAPESDAEFKLANQLIEHLAAKRFDPNEISDEHRSLVEAAIQRKVEGKWRPWAALVREPFTLIDDSRSMAFSSRILVQLIEASSCSNVSSLHRGAGMGGGA